TCPTRPTCHRAAGSAAAARWRCRPARPSIRSSGRSPPTTGWPACCTAGPVRELTPRSREIAILLDAFARAAPFALYAHRRAGDGDGLTGREIEGLAARIAPAFRCEQERLVFATTLRLLDRRHLDEDEHAEAVAGLGAIGLDELVTLVG